MIRPLPFALAFLVCASFCVTSFAAEVETILIRNVLLIDRAGENDDVLVNILIKHKKLVVVTKDEVASEEAALVLDAENGDAALVFMVNHRQ